MNKKFNKKKLAMFVLPILAIGLAVAGAVYYNVFSATFDVTPSVVVTGTLAQDLGTPHAGDLIAGTPVTITNDADSERTVTLTDDSNEDVDVSYLKELGMYTKDSAWVEQTLGATLHYTLIGNHFVYKVTQPLSPPLTLTDYVVVYYPDSTGNPGPWNIGSAVVIGDVTSELTLSETVLEDLPFGTDFNDEAKLWLMPKADVISQEWHIATILFEHELITHTHSDEGTITLQSKGSVELTPVYVIGDYASGSYTITTTVA